MEQINGMILLNKPLGKTSHDMVYAIRRLTGIKKVGHTGTLDPMAEGVLPICIGSATKAAELLTMADKCYRAELVLGMTTDTQDAEGEVLTQCPVNCGEEEIVRAVKDFEGEIDQIPPMYSAIKKDGKKLYELARQGKTVDRPSRRVTIYSIDIVKLDMEEGRVTIDVCCSKGTYIRTLCEDIGIRLGTGAYMNALVRTRTGDFVLENAYTMNELYALKSQGRLAEAVTPVDLLFSRYPRLVLNKWQAGRVKNGMAVLCEGIEEGVTYRVYDDTGEFIAVSEGTGGRLKLVKAFWKR